MLLDLAKQKTKALRMSDLICVNGLKKVDYILGWMSAFQIDVSKPILVSNMCFPQIEREIKITGSESKKRQPVTLFLGGNKQSWNRSSIDYVQLVNIILTNRWRLLNVRYSLVQTAEKLILFPE